MPTPKVFVIRHGETEWSLNGRHTSITDLELTSNGVRRVHATAKHMIGPDRLICPDRVKRVYVSPRKRAQETLKIIKEEHPAFDEVPVTMTLDLQEWNYGDYEGLTTAQIQQLRESRGIKDIGGKWDIWRDGCEGGEGPSDVLERVDRVINEIKEYQCAALNDSTGKVYRDVIVVSHGHLLRAFTARWVGRTVESNPSLILEAGGIGTLSYEHNNVNEPAIVLGSAFIVPNE
ncbi:hypothetical protein CANCADRAFT_30215 [Tortispora caseinolytica NRRL Y-17796]|uniref:Phosphoglycerate mutase-like protein n=1 Tax=Tortispora caseinolytica NRRL Y-17796 TaxID=767744 RepID=A0A1E4TJM3_9ASCO|nr:hypothetical protein CANCADRAFT_30215 [Tortispora caseinolytica NRRL Y-17796]